MDKIYIILVNYNSIEHTLECLQSIKDCEDVVTFNIVVDNASCEKVELEGVDCFIQLTDNKGFAGANNIGIKYALAQDDCSHIMLLNNDTALEPDALQHLLQSSRKEPSVIWGCKLTNYYKRDIYDHVGGVWNPQQAQFDLMLGGACIESRLQEGHKIDYVCGASMFSTREVFERVGPMDERYFLYFEEADWCQRAARLAIACKVCYDAICYHKGSASQTKPSLVLSYYLTRNRLLFIQKNKTTKEKMALFLPVFTQSLKLLFQCTLKTLFAKTTKQKSRVARLKAARKGLFDALSSTYHQGHF